MQVTPVGPCPTSIMLVGEAPGEQEEQRGEPFVGASGQELSRMLNEVGIMRSACFITNVVRVRPPANDISLFIMKGTKKAIKEKVGKGFELYDDKIIVPAVREGIEMLKREIEMCQPNIIIAFGNVALWALTGEGGITSWRGSLLECTLETSLDYNPKVIPTYHPAAILRKWDWRRIALHDLRRVKKESTTKESPKQETNFLLKPTLKDVLYVLSELKTQLDARTGRLSVDIETRSKHIACIGIAWSEESAVCIPLMHGSESEHYWTEKEEALVMFALYEVLTHKNCEVIGQNFLYDAQYFYRYLHYIPRVKRDTMISQHVLFNGLPKNLGFLSSMYCKYHRYWKEEGKEWESGKSPRQLWEYNCRDVIATFEVDTAQIPLFENQGLTKVNDFQQSMFYPVLHTMNEGVKIDIDVKANFIPRLEAEIEERIKWIEEVLGYPLNPNSHKQMQELFYKELNQSPIRHPKTKSLTCSKEALETIKEREPILSPLVNKIEEVRSLGIFLNTFAKAPLDYDSRMRCYFNIAGTDTYRFSSSENAFGSGTNMQNIPKGGEDDELELPNIRNMMVPDPSMTFFDVDLDSADLRIVAWESGEEDMQEMLNAGLKVYVEVMKEYYNDSTLTKQSPKYRIFKSFCHGTHYMGSPQGLAKKLGLQVHEVERLQSWYFSRFPRILKYHKDVEAKVRSNLYIENVFGYRRYYFDRIDKKTMKKVIAWIPQSTVACIINRGYKRIYDELKEVRVLLQVHDSVAGQFPSHLGDWAVQQIKNKLEIELPYEGRPMTIPVEVKTSKVSWGEC